MQVVSKLRSFPDHRPGHGGMSTLFRTVYGRKNIAIPVVFYKKIRHETKTRT